MYLKAIDDYLTFYVNTHDSTGAESDADSVPTYRIYEDETGTPILTGSMAKLDDAGTTGQYSEQIQVTAANGFEVNKCYSIRVHGVVGGLAGNMAIGLQVMDFAAAANVVELAWKDLLSSGNFAITGSIGKLFADNLNAAITSRMATFSLPTNFSTLAIDASGRVILGTDIAFGFKKNNSFSNFMFRLRNGTTGTTVTCQRSIDGAAFANCTTATATEMSAGWYKLNLSGADLNGDRIAFKATEPVVSDRFDLLIVTHL